MLPLLTVCLILSFVDIANISSLVMLCLFCIIFFGYLTSVNMYPRSFLCFSILSTFVIGLIATNVIKISSITMSLFGVLMYPVILLYFDSNHNTKQQKYYYLTGLMFVVLFSFLLVCYAAFAMVHDFNVGGFAYNFGNFVAPMLRPFSYSDMSFTETDVVPYFAILGSLLILSAENLIIKTIYAVIALGLSVLLGKSIIFVGIFYLYLFSFFSEDWSKVLFNILNIFCWSFPLWLIYMYQNLYLDDEVLNLLSSGRFSIWSEAIHQFLFKNGHIDVPNFLFGGSGVLFDYMMPLSQEWETVSYHSSYLRLFLMDGLLIYIIIFLYLSWAWNKFASRQPRGTKKIIFGYLSYNIIVSLTDYSIAYNFDFYSQFLLHLLIVKWYMKFNDARLKLINGNCPIV